MAQIIYKNNIIDFCPKKLYETYLTGNKNTILTESMKKGLYFESLLLGKGRTGSVFDLPRLKNGRKSIDQIRIESQAEMAVMVLKMYGMEVIKKGPLCNTQVLAKRPISFEQHPQVEFMLKGGLDLLTPVDFPDTKFKYDTAIVDIKLTGSRFNEHGKYCWGLPEYMDMTQGVLYSTITGLPFFYLVFDYKEKRGNGHVPIPVSTMAMFPNGLEDPEEEPYYNLAKKRAVDLKVNIKTTVEQILLMDSMGYPERPSYNNCELCPLNKFYPGGTCEHANFIKRV